MHLKVYIPLYSTIALHTVYNLKKACPKIYKEEQKEQERT